MLCPSTEKCESGTSEGGRAGGFEEFVGVGTDIAVAKDGVARNEEFGAGFDDVRDGFQVHSTIHFNAEIQFAFGAHAGKRSNFVEGIGNEFLAAKAGIDAHHQDVVDEVQHLGQSLNRSGGIQDHARLATVRGDQVQGAVEMHASFLVDGNPVGAGFGKFLDEEVGILDHEVAIEGNFKKFPQRPHNGRADGEIWDEVAVHDVQMEDRAAALDGLLCIAAKLREVGGKNRRREFDFHGTGVSPSRKLKLYDGQRACCSGSWFSSIDVAPGKGTVFGAAFESQLQRNHHVQSLLRRHK